MTRACWIDVAVPARRHPRLADEQRDRADLLVSVRLDLLGGPQDGHGPVADEVVQPQQGPAQNPLRLVPRAPLGQDGLTHPPKEERLEKRLVALMKQQVAMLLPITGQHDLEDQPQDRFGLLHVTERLALVLKSSQTGLQYPAEALPDGLRGVRLDRGELTEQAVDGPQETRVRGPGREVQVSEGLPHPPLSIGTQLIQVHRHRLLRTGSAPRPTPIGILWACRVGMEWLFAGHPGPARKPLPHWTAALGLCYKHAPHSPS